MFISLYVITQIYWRNCTHTYHTRHLYKSGIKIDLQMNENNKPVK